MSEDNLDILSIVAENPCISQRKIANQIGLSLGQVNFLIKKYAKKGLIKIVTILVWRSRQSGKVRATNPDFESHLNLHALFLF